MKYPAFAFPSETSACDEHLLFLTCGAPGGFGIRTQHFQRSLQWPLGVVLQISSSISCL